MKNTLIFLCASALLALQANSQQLAQVPVGLPVVSQPIVTAALAADHITSNFAYIRLMEEIGKRIQALREVGLYTNSPILQGRPLTGAYAAFQAVRNFLRPQPSSALAAAYTRRIIGNILLNRMWN